MKKNGLKVLVGMLILLRTGLSWGATAYDTIIQSFGFVQQNAPVFASASPLPQNRVKLSFTGGMANQTYTLQVATSLSAFSSKTTTLQTNSNVPRFGYPISASGWVSVSSTNTTTNTSFSLIDPNATGNLGYYRIYQGPRYQSTY